MRKLIDIVEGNLFEKHYSGPLYHSTSYRSASSIVEQGFFYLTNIRWSEAGEEKEGKWAPSNGYKYFLSTARMKNDLYKKLNALNVTFVLDPSSLPHGDYKVRQVNFFDNSKGRGESEERIWSKKDRIFLKGFVTEIHMLMESYDDQSEEDKVDYWKDAQNDLIHYAMQNRIPAYMYPKNQHQAFLQLNKKYAYSE